jgi:hypothetical protein
MRESVRARRAYADYLAMGEGRSLEKQAELYRQRQGTDSEATAPTVHARRLYEWSRVHGWQERLRAIADAAAAEAEAAIAARRRAVLGAGLALDVVRVDVLKRVAERLRAEIEEEGRLWVQDAKWIGSGEFGERVDIERFNAAEVEQLRGLLDDIAKEKGERVRRHEHSGRDGAPIPVQIVMPDNGRGDRAPA